MELAAIDLEPLTDFTTDLLTSVGTAGGLTVGIAAAALTFGFIIAWMVKARRAGTKG